MTFLTIKALYLMTKHNSIPCIVLYILLSVNSLIVVHSVEHPVPNPSDVKINQNGKLSGKLELTPLDLHRKLFQQKRQSHIEGVRAVMALGKYDKQYEMIKLVLNKIHSVVTESQVFLREKGYAPGDPFPTDEQLRDVVSKLAENTAFFGDMLLRLPDITHDILKRNREWEIAIKWGIGFCDSSELFEGQDLKMLDLMSQELGLVDKDPNYINPYKNEAQEENLQKELESLLKDKLVDTEKKEKKRKKKEKKKKGPRLSSVPHTEL